MDNRIVLPKSDGRSNRNVDIVSECIRSTEIRSTSIWKFCREEENRLRVAFSALYPPIDGRLVNRFKQCIDLGKMATSEKAPVSGKGGGVGGR